jgi:hypothetical protein
MMADEQLPPDEVVVPESSISDVTVDLTALTAWYQTCARPKGYRVNLYGQGVTSFNAVCRGAGSTVDMFPQTVTTVGNFLGHVSRTSVQDALFQDWSSIGCDIYHALLSREFSEYVSAGESQFDLFEYAAGDSRKSDNT